MQESGVCTTLEIPRSLTGAAPGKSNPRASSPRPRKNRIPSRDLRCGGAGRMPVRRRANRPGASLGTERDVSPLNTASVGMSDSRIARLCSYVGVPDSGTISSTTRVPRPRLWRRSRASQSAHTRPRLASFAKVASAGRKQLAMVSNVPWRFHIVPLGVWMSARQPLSFGSAYQRPRLGGASSRRPPWMGRAGYVSSGGVVIVRSRQGAQRGRREPRLRSPSTRLAASASF